MKNPLAAFQAPLESYQDMMHRIDASTEICKYLEIVARGNWRYIYKNPLDDTLLAEEFPFSEMHGGGLSLFYKMYTVDLFIWLESAPYLSSDIRAHKEDEDFIKVLGGEIGPEACRRVGCSRKRILYSVFCKEHHFESIRNKPYPKK